MISLIPASIVSSLKSFFSGGVFDVLWKAIVLSAFGLIFVMLLSVGVVGAMFAGLLLSTLVADDVRKLVSDLWHRDFYEP